MISALNVKTHILDVLSVVGCMRTDQMYLYFQKMYPTIKESFIHSVLYRLCKEQSIIEENDFLYISTKKEKKVSSVLFVWLLLEMIDDPTIHFDTGRFPADFVVAKGENIFQIVSYAENGSMKLNYLNRKEQYKDGVVVLIILHNEAPDAINSALLPSEPYQIVSIDTDGDLSNPSISYSQFFNA